MHSKFPTHFQNFHTSKISTSLYHVLKLSLFFQKLQYYQFSSVFSLIRIMYQNFTLISKSSPYHRFFYHFSLIHIMYLKFIHFSKFNNTLNFSTFFCQLIFTINIITAVLVTIFYIPIKIFSKNNQFSMNFLQKYM